MSATTIGLLTDENNTALNTIYTALTVTEAAFALYTIYRSLALSQAAINTALAAAETILHAAMMDWAGIAAAGVAAAAVFMVFEFASGEWTFPEIDIGRPMDRRAATRDLNMAVGGG